MEYVVQNLGDRKTSPGPGSSKATNDLPSASISHSGGRSTPGGSLSTPRTPPWSMRSVVNCLPNRPGLRRTSAALQGPPDLREILLI